MIKLLIFDWDDVFTLGAKDGYFKCYHQAITSLGIHLSPEEERKRILAKWSKPYPEELKEILKENPELVDKACRIWEKLYWGDTFVNSLREVKGANELLTRLKGKYILTIATGNHPKLLNERIFPYFKIPNVFSQIVTSWDIADVDKMKPHPYMLELIMKAQKVLPQETLYIGDAKTDFLMAKNAGVTPIVVLTGNLSRREAVELKAKYILEDVTKIETILNELGK